MKKLTTIFSILPLICFGAASPSIIIPITKSDITNQATIRNTPMPRSAAMLSSLDVVDTILSNSVAETIIYEASLLYLPKGNLLIYGVWTNNFDLTNNRGYIAAAYSDTLENFVKIGPILEPSTNAWETGYVSPGRLYKEGGTNYLTYFAGATSGFEAFPARIGIAYSTDGTNWVRGPSNPILDVGASGAWDDETLFVSSILKVGFTYYLYYNAARQAGQEQIGFATSTNIFGPYTKYSGNPIMEITGGGQTLADPSVFSLNEGGWGMFYRIWDQFGSNVSRPAMSYSYDLTNWFPRLNGTTNTTDSLAIPYSERFVDVTGTNVFGNELFGGGIFEDDGIAYLMDNLNKIYLLRPSRRYNIISNIALSALSPNAVTNNDTRNLTFSNTLNVINGFASYANNQANIEILSLHGAFTTATAITNTTPYTMVYYIAGTNHSVIGQNDLVTMGIINSNGGSMTLIVQPNEWINITPYTNSPQITRKRF